MTTEHTSADEAPRRDGSALSEGLGAVVPTAELVEILPTKVWIESDMLGARHVVMHHQGFGNPFTYASFYYDYAYTSNAGTWEAANRLALALGATEPVEQRQHEFHVPTADELRQQIKLLQDELARIEAAKEKGIRPASAEGRSGSE
jgi:uncharacterized small protein (DUF1192 family)